MDHDELDDDGGCLDSLVEGRLCCLNEGTYGGSMTMDQGSGETGRTIAGAKEQKTMDENGRW